MLHSTPPKRNVASAGLALASVGLAVLLVLSSCDSLLQKEPESFVAPENFYRNKADAGTAVNGAYNGLRWMEWQNPIRLLMLPTTMLTDFLPVTSSVAVFDVWNWTPSNNWLQRTWSEIYDAINRANAAIDNVPSIEMDEALRGRLVAEARFLRAYQYFTLVRLFGGVPLRIHETASLDSLQMARASADEVYRFLISELQDIQSDLPPVSAYSGMDKARASRGAAKTLLAKVYLHRGGGGTVTATPQPEDFQNAARLLKEVMESGEYRLVSVYSDLFSWENGRNERNEETIFTLEHMQLRGQGQQGFQIVTPQGSDFGSAQYGLLAGGYSFLRSYDDADVRLEASWLTEYVDSEGNLRTLDLDDPENDSFVSDDLSPRKLFYEVDDMPPASGPRDFILLRYGEVLLMYAEALNEMKGGPTPAAYAAINQVRRRAGLPDLTPGLSYEQFKDSLFDERQWELTQEFKGWYTCQRFWEQCRTALEAFKSRAHPSIDIELQEPKHRLYPIPQKAIDRNPKLDQNPGYGR